MGMSALHARTVTCDICGKDLTELSWLKLKVKREHFTSWASGGVFRTKKHVIVCPDFSCVKPRKET